MNSVWKPILTLIVALLLASDSLAQSLIPAPGAPQGGYFVQFSDTTPDSTSRPPAEPAAWEDEEIIQPMPALHPVGTGVAPAMTGAVGSAACSTCADLWTGACDGPHPVGTHHAGPLLAAGACVTGDCGAGTCGTVACDGMCDGSCCGGCDLWAHRTFVFGSALYLRPRNADVAYAVPIDGPITSSPANYPLQIGRIGTLDPDYESGFSAGINLAVTCETSWFVEFAMLDSSTSDSISTSAPDVLRSMVAHPSTTSAATDFLTASANLDLSFETLDAGVRRLLKGGPCYAVNYILGARYSRLEQQFDSIFVDNGTETVSTDIDFDGGGLRLGLDAERQSDGCGLRLYTRGSASFLAGRFRGQYFQGQSFDPTVVETSWEAGRVVPILDVELGAGWTSPGGCLRLSAGYLVSAWFNTVKTEDFIQAVQTNNFVDLGDSLTFDGLRAAAEWRF